MKAAAQGLQDLLYNNDQHYSPALITLYFADGTKRWTNHGESLTYGGNTWTVGPGLDVGDLRFTSGIATDTFQLTLYPDASTVGGVSLPVAARAGLFDSIRVTVDLAFMLTSSDPSAGVITYFDGFVSVAEPTSTEVRITARSLMERLIKEIPSRTNMPQCPFRLFSTACGVTEVSHSRTVAAGSTATVVNLSSSSTYAITGGRLVVGGFTRTIRSVLGAAVTVAVPLPAVPSTGATVTVYPGCDKLRPTCRDTYSNLVRFGGFPDTPKSEVA